MKQKQIVSKLINIGIISAMLVAVMPSQSLAAVTATNLLADPSFEDASCASPAPNSVPCWQNFGSGFTRVATARTGSGGISLNNASDQNTSGASQRIDLNQTEQKPVFIGGYVKGSNITMAAGSWFGASLYVEIYLTNGQQIAYWNSIPNSGTFDWRWIGFNTGNLSTVNAPIAYIYVVPILKNASGTAYFDDITVSEFTPTQGAVTLMFDDGEISTYTEAKKLLDRYGFVGSSAVISDQTDELGFMNPTQITALQAGGWEIVSHSRNHEDMTLMTPANYNSEYSLSKTALESFLGAGSVKDFAFPLGAYNADLLAAAAANGYQSARAYETGDNSLGLFPYDVKVRSVIGSTKITDVQGWLTQAKTQNLWTMLVMHTVTERGDDSYHTSPAHLNHILEAIKASGLSVITYDQGIQTYSVGMGTSTPIIQ